MAVGATWRIVGIWIAAAFPGPTLGHIVIRGEQATVPQHFAAKIHDGQPIALRKVKQCIRFLGRKCRNLDVVTVRQNFTTS